MGGVQLVSVGRAFVRSYHDSSAALDDLTRALEALESLGLESSQDAGLARGVRLVCSALHGEHRRGDQWALAEVGRRDSDLITRTLAFFALVMGAAARGDRDGVTRALAGLRDQLAPAGAVPLRLFLHLAEARAHTIEGDEPAAWEALARLGRTGGMMRLPSLKASLMELRLEAALAHLAQPAPARRADALREAAVAGRWLGRRGMDAQRCLGWLSRCRVALSSGDEDAARTAARRAVDTSESAGPLRRWRCLTAGAHLGVLSAPALEETHALAQTHRYAPLTWGRAAPLPDSL
jgi:hypothetical protein